ncbi:protocatechuate 3,4-dioxygenase [Erythrobacter alti]|uniref:protocatechuate 3,4-dioxygenase n=1 Tax=Erythrobacter alti TaxID=1896145 RepID=UPI0030F472D3
MSKINHRLSRRAFTASSLSAASLLFAGRSLAQDHAVSPTPEQALGPFYPSGYAGEDDADLTMIDGRTERALGDVIEVTGRVLDRHGNPMSGARIELWQANAAGRYAHANDISTGALDPNFQGMARLVTGSSGEWRIRTIKPRFYDTPLGLRTPHIHFDVQGTSHRLITQMYFDDEADQNSGDFVYAGLGGQAPMTVARTDGPASYRWDIVLMDAV